MHEELTFPNGPITRSKAKQLKMKLQIFVQEFLFKQLEEACETSKTSIESLIKIWRRDPTLVGFLKVPVGVGEIHLQ